MKSKNFKKILSASIASLTMLSTLSGSVSTKIYATKNENSQTKDVTKDYPEYYQEIGEYEETSTFSFLHNGYYYLMDDSRLNYDIAGMFREFVNEISNEEYRSIIPPTKGYVFYAFGIEPDKKLIDFLLSDETNENKKLAIKNFMDEIAREAEKNNFQITDQRLIEKLKALRIKDINAEFRIKEKEIRENIEKFKKVKDGTKLCVGNFLYNNYHYIIDYSSLPVNSPEWKASEIFAETVVNVIDDYKNDRPSKGYVFYAFDPIYDKEFLETFLSNRDCSKEKCVVKEFLNKIANEAEYDNFEIKDIGLNRRFNRILRELKIGNTVEEVKKEEQKVTSTTPEVKNVQTSASNSGKETKIEKQEVTSTPETENTQPSANNSGKETKIEMGIPAENKVSLWKKILNFFKKIPLIGRVFKFFFK